MLFSLLLFLCNFPMASSQHIYISNVSRIYEAKRSFGLLHRPKQEIHTRKCPFCLQAEFPGCFHQNALAGKKQRPGTANGLRSTAEMLSPPPPPTPQACATLEQGVCLSDLDLKLPHGLDAEWGSAQRHTPLRSLTDFRALLLLTGAKSVNQEK